MISFFIIFVLLIIIIITLNRIKIKKERELLPDDEPVQDIIEAVDYNGHMLYLSEADKKVWKTLSTTQKQQIHLKQIGYLKSGALVKVMDGKKVIGIVTRAEAIVKGLIK